MPVLIILSPCHVFSSSSPCTCPSCSRSRPRGNPPHRTSGCSHPWYTATSSASSSGRLPHLFPLLSSLRSSSLLCHPSTPTLKVDLQPYPSGGVFGVSGGYRPAVFQHSFRVTPVQIPWGASSGGESACGWGLNPSHRTGSPGGFAYPSRGRDVPLRTARTHTRAETRHTRPRGAD